MSRSEDTGHKPGLGVCSVGIFDPQMRIRPWKLRISR